MRALLHSARLACFFALVLVCAQLATVAYACAKSSAAAMEPVSMAGMPDCHKAQHAESPVLCKAHCQKDSQSAELKIPAPSLPVLVALFFLAPTAEAAQLRSVAPPTPPTLAAASPPLRVQYQVFRN
ncbi:hypothetical protein [Niveibacterium sp. SC-1]|uniref:hypothetical protein n=1 Tax=Niveibacterium sp. SC-1 TaxID=3135646 RepID=UPI0031200CF0